MKQVIRTDVGVVRTENQDKAAIFHNDKFTLAILCDGMGGHKGGSHASQITIDTFQKEFEKSFKETKVESWFESTIKKSKKEMISYSGSDKNLLDMGTTVTAAIILEEEVYIFNIGDSRTYVFNGLLHQITKDHNLRNHYINKFGYTPEDAAKVMGAAALTSALGPEKTISVDTYIVPRDESVKSVILTCDGIHDYVSKPQMEQVISSDMTVEEKAEELIALGIKGKSSDNLTVAIVDLEAK